MSVNAEVKKRKMLNWAKAGLRKLSPGRKVLEDELEPSSEEEFVRIGQYEVPKAFVSPARDSAWDLRAGNFALLAKRLQNEGYLAFSRFFERDLAEAARSEVVALAGGGDEGAGFEVNVTTSREDGTKWAALGEGPAFRAVSESEALQTALKDVLGADERYRVPEELTFQLAWVRGKGLDDATAVHVDYYHVAERDKLTDAQVHSFNVWTNLGCAGEGATSHLALSPGSHLLPPDHGEGGSPRACPSAFAATSSRWEVLDAASGLEGPGTVVLMSLQLVHAATASETRQLRVSLDRRFRLPLRELRPIEYGRPPAPHWGECSRWTPACHAQHPQLMPYVLPLLLVNQRLKRDGRVHLLRDLVALVLNQLLPMVTPIWREEPVRVFQRRTTGYFPPEWDLESTSTLSDAEMNAYED